MFRLSLHEWHLKEADISQHAQQNMGFLLTTAVTMLFPKAQDLAQLCSEQPCFAPPPLDSAPVFSAALRHGEGLLLASFGNKSNVQIAATQKMAPLWC